MKAAYYYKEQDIRVEEVPLPFVSDNDMLIKVKKNLDQSYVGDTTVVHGSTLKSTTEIRKI